MSAFHAGLTLGVVTNVGAGQLTRSKSVVAMTDSFRSCLPGLRGLFLARGGTVLRQFDGQVVLDGLRDSLLWLEDCP